MRPYRYRALPRKRKSQPVEAPKPPEPTAPELDQQADIPSSMNINSLVQILSMLQPSNKGAGMQALLPYLAPQLKSIAGPVFNAANSEPMSEGERIRAAIAKHENKSNVSSKNVLQALKNLPRDQSEQFEKAASVVENMEKMQDTFAQISRDPTSFLSKHLGARLKEQAKDNGPLVEMLMNKQTLTPETLMPALMKNNTNPFLSMLMQNGLNGQNGQNGQNGPNGLLQSMLSNRNPKA